MTKHIEQHSKSNIFSASMARRKFLSTALYGLGGAFLFPRALFSAGSEKLSFFVIGDWGTGGKGQRAVAAAILERYRAGQYNAVISTGDNFYPSGVESSSDKQWKTKFTSIYEGLELPWYPVLGNHDYRLNPDAQWEYSQLNALWKMPSRYYSQYIAQAEEQWGVELFCFDTQALLQKKDVKKQLDYFDKRLSESKAHWKIAVGHHPLRSGGHYGDNAALLKMFSSRFAEYGVQMYLCGHDHDLQFLKHEDDSFVCLVSGSGGGTRPTSATKSNLFAQSELGFAECHFSSERCTVEFYSSRHKKLFETEILRTT